MPLARTQQRERPPRENNRLIGNIALSLASIVFFLLVCEFVVFRLVWPASDVPANAYVDEVVRYAPDQRGTWRVRDEIAAPYAINAQGWNSGIGDYRLERQPGVGRIALIGDSYVEALTVPHDRSLGERIAAILAADGPAVEVLRFGISGAPLSQYLQMLQREAGRYRPDWVVVLIVHNDFDESYRRKPGRYTSSFLKLQVENGRVIDEISPQPWRPGTVEWLRRSATARFFRYRWQLRPDFLDGLLTLQAHAAAPVIAANVDISAILSDRAAVEAVIDYLFDRIDGAARAAGARLLLVIDGDRQAIYRGIDSPALALNRIAEAAAARRGIRFIDLHPVFAANWQREGRQFEFEADNHWNEHGHAVAASAVAARLRAEGFAQGGN